MLGCSGSVVGPDSPASGYLLSAPDTPPLVVDFGGGVLGALQRHADPNEVHVLLSHLHADHCLDLPGLFVWRRYHPVPATTRGIMYGPSDTWTRLAAASSPVGGELDDFSDIFEVRTWVEANGLTLHPDKTHVGDCRQKGEGFEFLGYRFEAGRRWVRKKSLKRIKDAIRSKTGRMRGGSLKDIINDLNPTLRGWFGYFKHAQRSTFNRLDGFIRRRLRAMLRKREKRPGMGRCLSDHKRWSNAFFAGAGLFALYPARLASGHPR